VVDVLGSGGMGIVYRARDLRHGVTVAVKTMRQVDAAAVSRFKQEFRALLDVSHPNLVTLYELISDGRQWFIVMEYVDGVGFLDHVRGAARPAGGDVSPSAWGLAPSTVDFPETAVAPPPAPGGRRAPAPPATALAAVGPAGGERLRRALRGLACGLAALHQAGRLHRDIKPSNVMVTRQGRVVLMDFGLVTTPDRGAGEASTGGQVVGTAAYMAPEQAAGLRASEASDWYSVGVIIYEALTGRLPFSGPPLQVLMDKQRYEPPPPRELAPDAPDDLNLLCSELLHRDPGARPTSREVLERLGAVEPGGDGATGPPPSSRDFAFQAAFFSASAGTSSRAERSLSSVRRLWTRIDRPA
jgi:serine/threonine protein kinase